MLLFLMAAVVLTALAAVSDHRTGRIPNWLTLGGLCAALVGHLGHGWLTGGVTFGLIQLGFSVAGALFCSLAPAILFVKGGMGGGDLKLFAALGALCHPMLGIEAQLYSLLIAAVVAPARLAYDGKLWSVLGRSLSLLLNPFRSRERRQSPPAEVLTWFRLGPAIFLGTLVTTLSNLFTQLSPG